jgi:hypothetical protein
MNFSNQFESKRLKLWESFMTDEYMNQIEMGEKETEKYKLQQNIIK